MSALADRLLQIPAIAGDARARELAVILTVPTGRTSSGHPYLQEPAWTRFRDWVPHILHNGERVLSAVDVVVAGARGLSPLSDGSADGSSVDDAAKVVRQVVMTASITAPPDLWLMRHVLASFARLGLSQRLLAGEVVRPDRAVTSTGAPLSVRELVVDLRFLLGRGLLIAAPTRSGAGGYRRADHEAARAAFSWTPSPIDPLLPSSLASAWARAFRKDAATTQHRDERAALAALYASPLPGSSSSASSSPGRFTPGPHDIELGWRLLPIVLGLRAAGRAHEVLERGLVDVDVLLGRRDEGAPAGLGAAMVATLHAAGVCDDAGVLGAVGKRVLEKGIGPFGIIEAYHAYMHQLDDILVRGRGAVWVERGANVAASQDANRHTFEQANDSLDRFCSDTGFDYGVFVEHALGKGEATRQRALRASEKNPKPLQYVGADLEDAAVDAAVAERDLGRLPSSMVFVRKADIGQPALLIDAMRAQQIDPKNAVMIVGNGFHEVREQTDEKMTSVLRGYADAGVVLLFTEETGLSVDDLLATAWNTYHAGFKYVHERSGQGLRPAEKRPPSPFEIMLPLSWAECAERAGYVRLEAYCSRGRTVYPYTPASGHNPSISVTHFCVPRAVVEKLGIVEGGSRLTSV